MLLYSLPHLFTPKYLQNGPVTKTDPMHPFGSGRGYEIGLVAPAAFFAQNIFSFII
jgi:hypothetical protein